VSAEFKYRYLTVVVYTVPLITDLELCFISLRRCCITKIPFKAQHLSRSLLAPHTKQTFLLTFPVFPQLFLRVVRSRSPAQGDDCLDEEENLPHELPSLGKAAGCLALRGCAG